MSFIGNMFSGDKGNGWQAQGTNILNPSTVDQANQTYGQAQTGLEQQQAFLQALQGQNGIQNQSNVFNQLQGVANGTGPNPAQAMLNQATGANVANQAALMAGQRGAGSNVGLIARQAAQQGANTQQQAAGQGATMQANQSLNAMNQLGGIAGQQVANQMGATSGYTQAAQSANANVLNGIGQQNQANVGMQSNINNANAGIAGINAQAQNQLIGKGIGGLMNAAGGATGLAKGGEVPSATTSKSRFAQYLADGGGVSAPGAIDIGTPMQAPKYDLFEGAPSSKPKNKPDNSASGDTGSGVTATGGGGVLERAHGGTIDAMVSPGEKYLSPKEAIEIGSGKKNLKEVGKTIPGKAKVKGDSYANDIVPAKLEEGGFVIPREVMQSKNPDWAAHAFVRAHLSNKSKMGGKK